MNSKTNLFHKTLNNKIRTVFGFSVFLINLQKKEILKPKQWYISWILQRAFVKQDNIKSTTILVTKEKLNHYIKIRNLFYLPLRGQRTHTNARTCKNKNPLSKNKGYRRKK